MLGYKIVRVEKPPAEAWREMKQTANQLAVSLTECWREICRQIAGVCGQMPYMAQMDGMDVGHERVCVRVQSGWLWLPRNEREPWEFKASEVRSAIDKMAAVTRDRLQEAADEALEQ